jgi:hypothetical protein
LKGLRKRQDFSSSLISCDSASRCDDHFRPGCPTESSRQLQAGAAIGHHHSATRHQICPLCPASRWACELSAPHLITRSTQDARNPHLRVIFDERISFDPVFIRSALSLLWFFRETGGSDIPPIGPNNLILLVFSCHSPRLQGAIGCRRNRVAAERRGN